MYDRQTEDDTLSRLESRRDEATGSARVRTHQSIKGPYVLLVTLTVTCHTDDPSIAFCQRPAASPQSMQSVASNTAPSRALQHHQMSTMSLERTKLAKMLLRHTLSPRSFRRLLLPLRLESQLIHRAPLSLPKSHEQRLERRATARRQPIILRNAKGKGRLV